MWKKLFVLFYFSLIIFPFLEEDVHFLLRSTFNLDHKKMISLESTAHSKAHLIDVRSYEEYEVSHLPNAIWLESSNIALFDWKDIGSSDSIIVYCSIGIRADEVAKKLEKAGFEHVYNMDGGIFKWVNTGRDIVDSKGEQGKQIHAYNRIWGLFLSKGEKVYY